MRKFIKYGLPYFTLVFMVICVFMAQRLSVYRQIMQESLELSRTINSKIGIDTTSSIDSLKNLVIKLQLENQNYSSNIEIFSNYIILFVTLLFGIFFAVGYGIFDNKVDQTKAENIESLRLINEAHAKHENELLELKKFMFNDRGNSSVLLADFCNKNGYYFEELKFKIIAADSYNQSNEVKVGKNIVKHGVIFKNLEDAYNILKQKLQEVKIISDDQIAFIIENTTIMLKSIDKLTLVDVSEISQIAAKIKVELHDLQEKINAQYNP